jgi:hypothetical protein
VVTSAAPSATGSGSGNLTVTGSAQVAQATKASEGESLVASVGTLIAGVAIAIAMM